MIKSIKVTNYLGDSIKLVLREPEKSGFLIKSITGLGPVKATINTTKITTGDGSTYNSSRSDNRNIVMDIVFVESVNHENIEDLRQKSYKYFPLKKNLEFEIETDNRVAKTVGYVESNEPNIFSEEENTRISIVCPDPYWYSTKEENVTNFYTIEPMFEFPFSNELEGLGMPENDTAAMILSAIHTKAEGSLVYRGDAEIGVEIHIHALGPASDINIYNIGTRENMRINTEKIETITGSGIIAMDDIVISTLKEQKSITLIRNGVSYNILNCLDKNTDWFIIGKGDNRFGFTAESGSTNLQFAIKNKVIYEGV